MVLTVENITYKDVATLQKLLVRRVRQLRKSGASYREIRDMTGVNLSSAYEICTKKWERWKNV